MARLAAVYSRPAAAAKIDAAVQVHTVRAPLHAVHLVRLFAMEHAVQARVVVRCAVKQALRAPLAATAAKDVAH